MLAVYTVHDSGDLFFDTCWHFLRRGPLTSLFVREWYGDALAGGGVVNRTLEWHIADEFKLILWRWWHCLALGLVCIEYECRSVFELLYLLCVEVYSCFADATGGDSVSDL